MPYQTFNELPTRFAAGLHDLAAGRASPAVAAFRSVLRDDPGHSGARRNLIRALIATGAHGDVIEATDLALRLAPESAELHYLRGTSLNALSRPADANEAFAKAVALNPRLAPAWLNLANARVDLDDLPGAEAHCRHAIALDARLIEAHVSLGFILTALGRPKDAALALETAIRLAPDDVQAHWNLAVAALLAGDFARGFAEYEWRKRHDLFRRDFIDLPGPIWSGDDPSNRVILIHAEQGLGDTIQFTRYLPLIARCGGRPILACEPSLIPLLRLAGDDIHVVSKFETLPRYDAWIDQMSLPRVFNTTPGTIPSPAGYLNAPDRIELPPGRNIGLAFLGNPLHRNDRRRTPSPCMFAQLLAVPGCRFISLVPDRLLPGTEAPPNPLEDYGDTASLIAALDLVITVDTSVAHVAGAIGRPAWVLLPHAPDWRWLLDRNDTPWYRSLRLFRQPTPGDWSSVVEAVIAALAR